MKKKHFIFIIQNNNKNRKRIKKKEKKDESFEKKIKHEPNIVEITPLCIRHGVPVRNQPVQNVQWEEGTKPIPVRNQPIPVCNQRIRNV